MFIWDGTAVIPEMIFVKSNLANLMSAAYAKSGYFPKLAKIFKLKEDMGKKMKKYYDFSSELKEADHSGLLKKIGMV